jgi:hypothetical protein
MRIRSQKAATLLILLIITVIYLANSLCCISECSAMGRLVYESLHWRGGGGTNWQYLQSETHIKQCCGSVFIESGFGTRVFDGQKLKQKLQLNK